MKASGLRAHAENANLGTDEGRALIKESIRRFGFLRPTLVDRNDTLIAGNQTVSQSADAQVQIVELSGSELLVHVRDDLDIADPETRAAAHADGQCSVVGLRWNKDLLIRDADRLGLRRWWTDPELGIKKPKEAKPEPWKVLRLTVPDSVYAQWESLMGSMDGETESEKFSRLLDRVEARRHES